MAWYPKILYTGAIGIVVVTVCNNKIWCKIFFNNLIKKKKCHDKRRAHHRNQNEYLFHFSQRGTAAIRYDNHTLTVFGTEGGAISFHCSSPPPLGPTPLVWHLFARDSIRRISISVVLCHTTTVRIAISPFYRDPNKVPSSLFV